MRPTLFLCQRITHQILQSGSRGYPTRMQDRLLFTITATMRLITSLILFMSLACEASAEQTQQNSIDDWELASNRGDYDKAVSLATSGNSDNALGLLLQAARDKQLAETSQWRSFIHYKPALGNSWLSQVDSQQFFLSDQGKRSPSKELDATLAAFFSNTAKPPLRLTATCRFVARRFWLVEQLPEHAHLLPEASCPEFDRYVNYLDADLLTLIFPTAHPNSPSSAFGHTLLRIDKKDQKQESRLLNMSINFAAEVPENVSGSAYAIKGLAGGFPGKFRLLPYHIKLREYGQIENRDTWEYPLNLNKAQVDLVLRHAYEMLISHFDYYFFSENCSYHLLSLLEVAFPDEPLTDSFGLWTIPVDTIRLLHERDLAEDGSFVPSSLRTLKARRDDLTPTESNLSLAALEDGLPAIDEPLAELETSRQAAILDLLSDYERYTRLKSDTRAQGSNITERSILSKRSKLGVRSEEPDVATPANPPDQGHGTARLGLNYHYLSKLSKQLELTYRPAYHDFRDPSAAFGDNASIQLGLLGIAHDVDTEDTFLKRFTVVSIESIEPRGEIFKPVSWHTNLGWFRSTADTKHEFTFNVGAGTAFQPTENGPLLFVFGESDIVDAPAFQRRRHWRLGASAGFHWEPVSGIRSGLELNYRRQVGRNFYRSSAELWLGFALNSQLSLNIDLQVSKEPDTETLERASAGIRTYF